MLTIIYVCILIIGSYFINTTVSKALCNSQAVRWTDILLATLLPWIIIFFTLFIVLKIFPGWVTPFSNTVGYLVISILGVETTLTAILNNNTNVNGDLAKAIANITHNKSNFINQIDINKTTFLNFIDELKKVGIIDLNKPEPQDEVAIQQQQQQGGGPGEDAIGPHMAKGLAIRKTDAQASAALAAAQEAQYKIYEKAEAAAAAAAARVAPPASGVAFQKAAGAARGAAASGADEQHHRHHKGHHRRHHGTPDNPIQPLSIPGAPSLLVDAAQGKPGQREAAHGEAPPAAAAETNVGKEVRAQLKPELQGDDNNDSRPPHTILEQGALDKPRQAERSTTELLMPGAPSFLADAGQRDEGQRDAGQRETAHGEAAQGEAGQGEPAEQDNTKPDIQNLYKLLVIKNVIGQLTWYTLAGVLVCSVSYNYIINMSCEKSLEEITADLNNAEAESLEYAQESG
jgi:hypothetical protein